ncbi:hypothetical protein MC885_007646 [Smutsia gigantea]|nr:hypothetical protein MC885_007646 [Smutsia gigantea]
MEGADKPWTTAEVVEGADNQRAGGQGSSVRQNVYRGYRPVSTGVLPPKDGVERMAMKSIRKIKERDPRSAATSPPVTPQLQLLMEMPRRS